MNPLEIFKQGLECKLSSQAISRGIEEAETLHAAFFAVNRTLWLKIRVCKVLLRRC
jgi:hypothetical protein